MKAEFVEVALNVPINQTFTYSAIPAGKILAQEKKIARRTFAKKTRAQSRVFRMRRRSARSSDVRKPAREWNNHRAS